MTQNAAYPRRKDAQLYKPVDARVQRAVAYVIAVVIVRPGGSLPADGSTEPSILPKTTR